MIMKKILVILLMTLIIGVLLLGCTTTEEQEEEVNRGSIEENDSTIRKGIDEEGVPHSGERAPDGDFKPTDKD